MGFDPDTKMDSLGSMNFIQPILLEMDAWLLKTNSAKCLSAVQRQGLRFSFIIKERVGMDMLSVLIAVE